MNGFDLRPIFEWTTISNMDPILGDINILDKKGQHFSDPHSRFIEQPDEQTITLIRTSVEEHLHLISRNDLGVSISHLAFCTRSVFRRETAPACARHRWREDTAGGSSTPQVRARQGPIKRGPCLARTWG